MTRNKKIILGIGLIIAFALLIAIGLNSYLTQKKEKSVKFERCIEWCWKNRVGMINSCIDSCQLAPEFYYQFLPPYPEGLKGDWGR